MAVGQRFSPPRRQAAIWAVIAPRPLRSALRRHLADLEMASIHVIGTLPVHGLRAAAARAWGATIHPTVTIYHGWEVRGSRTLAIGARSSIGNDAILDARGGLTIGEDVNLSTGVHIWTGQHDWNSPDFAYVAAPVAVGNRVWLSARVTVLPGVRIGEGAVVAAGAVVTRDVPPYALAAGVPAKVIGERRRDLRYRLPDRRRKQWWW